MSAPTLHPGSVVAHAIWFPPGTRGVRSRVMALWTPGCSAAALGGGVCLTLAEPARMRTREAPGYLLVDKSAVQGVKGAEGVALLQGGEVCFARPVPLDAATWIDLAGFTVANVVPLGPPPTPVAAPQGFDVRVALKRPPPTAEAQATGAALALPAPAPTALGGALATVGQWLLKLTQAPSPGPGQGGGAGNVPAPSRPHEPAWWQRALRRVAAPLWGPLLGGVHARHLAKLFDLFDTGKLEEALRHAIPLGGEGLGGLGAPWQLPGPRQDLALGGATGPGTSLGLASDVYKQLEAMYERALEKLLAEKKIDEAVFVLVELLRAHARAVDLLEREKRFELAAEIAIKGNLPPERAIRLYLLAGQPAKAALLARRTGSFAVACSLLQRDNAALALVLRRAWAESLARQGDAAGACTVAWEARELRDWAMPLLDQALAQGGPGGARLVGHLLRGKEGDFERARARVLPLLEGEDYEAVQRRVALANGLVGQPREEARVLLRATLRGLLADQGRWPELVDAAFVRTLADRAGDPAIAADIPSLERPTRDLGTRAEPIRLRLEERGALAVRDVAWLGDGGCLVALGELGARLYARDGRVRTSFPEPADALVPADNHRRCIGVSRRDWGLRLSHIDLDSGTARRWYDASFTAFADSTDGSMWFVAEKDCLVGVDVLSDGPRSLYRVNRVGGPVRSIARDTTTMTALIDGQQRERWVHALVNLRLTARKFTLAPEPGVAEWLTPAGTLHSLSPSFKAAEGTGTAWTVLFDREPQGTIPYACGPVPDVARPLALAEEPGTSRRAGAFAYPGGCAVLLWSSGRLVMSMELPRAATCGLRFREGTLALWDDQGRVLVLETRTGSVLRGLRVR